MSRKGSTKHHSQQEQKDLESLIFGKEILQDITVSKTNKRDRSESSSVLSTKSNNDGAVWVDEDDDVVQIDLNSVSRLKKLKTFVEPEEDDDDEDNNYSDESDNDVDDEEERNSTRRAKSNATKTMSGRNPDILFGSELSERLKTRFETQTHSWANVNFKTHEQSLDSLLQSESSMATRWASSKGKKSGQRGQQTDRELTPLTNGKINIKRCTDVNVASPSHHNSSITSIKFHPTRSDLVLVGDSDKHLKLFRITPQTVGTAASGGSGSNNSTAIAAAAGAVENECEFDIRLADLSIHHAEFLPSRSSLGAGKSASAGLSEILVTGRKPYFYSYDTTSGSITKHTSVHKQIVSYEHMALSPGVNGGSSGSNSSSSGLVKMAVAGASGYVHILDAHRKQWISDIKMNTGARCMCFYDDNTFVSSGVDAGVYVWDLRYTGRCLHKFMNEDGTGSTSLAVATPPRNKNSGSGSGYGATQTHYMDGNGMKCLAIGSESGVVSLYDIQTLLPINNAVEQKSAVNTYPNPKPSTTPVMRPYKACMNLSTVITSMAMHSNNQLLAVASDRSRDQLRLIHTPSGTVYSNWPTDKTPFRRVTSLAFSHNTSTYTSANSNGNYLAVGNNKGKVLLYQINHQL